MNIKKISKTLMEDAITCPHCGFQPGDDFEYPDDGEEYCDQCLKQFRYSRDVSVSYFMESLESEV